MGMAQNIPCSFTSLLHNKDIFCYFDSFLVDSGRFQLTNRYIYYIFTSEIGGDQTWPPQFHPRIGSIEGDVFYSFSSLPPTLFEVSNITSIEYLLISHNFKR